MNTAGISEQNDTGLNCFEQCANMALFWGNSGQPDVGSAIMHLPRLPAPFETKMAKNYQCGLVTDQDENLPNGYRHPTTGIVPLDNFVCFGACAQPSRPPHSHADRSRPAALPATRRCKLSEHVQIYTMKNKDLIVYVASAPAIYLTAASWHHEGENAERTLVFKSESGEVVGEIPAEFFLGVVLESASRQAKPGFGGG